jgi:hypothetical protein
MSDENNPTDARPDPETPVEPGNIAVKTTAAHDRARIALRVSLVCIAIAVTAFTFFLPAWVDRGVTQVNRGLLQTIAEDTAHKIVENDWSAKQGMDYAAGQSKLGNVDTHVAIAIDAKKVSVHIRATANSANPFDSVNGTARENHIEVNYSLNR